MPTPASPPKPLVRRVHYAGCGAVAALVLLAGCSSKPDAQYKPAEAASAVRRSVGLSSDQTTCLQGKFEADPSSAAALNSGLAAKEAREAFVVAMRACVPIDAFVDLMTNALQELFAGGDEARATCLKGALRGLPTSDQDLFYVYFSNAGGVDRLEVESITKKIRDTCRLDLTGPTSPGASPTTAAG